MWWSLDPSIISKLVLFLLRTIQNQLNSLPNDGILGWSKLKAFADDKKNVTKELKFDFERVENF